MFAEMLTVANRKSCMLGLSIAALFAMPLLAAAQNIAPSPEWRSRNIVPYEFYEKVLGPPATQANMARFQLPFPMTLAWDPSKQVTNVLVHKKAVAYFTKAFSLLHQRNLSKEASVFGGTYNVRKLRGSDRWNAHAWGVEIDIDPMNNQFSWGPKQFKMDLRVVEAFEEAGFYWRGRLGYDAMSFSLSFESIKEIAKQDGINIE